MILKYDIEISNDIIVKNINRITDRIFKLLPSREEGGDWQAPLKNLIIELGGMDELFLNHIDLFPLLCKLEALLTLTGEDDFFAFRRTIFECLGLCNHLKEAINDERIR